MIVDDIKRDFYNVLIGKHCILVINFDIDAICACKILQALFKCDNIMYTVIPVRGVSDLKIAFEENKSEVEYFIFVNCGGTLDLGDLLDPVESVFFVIDSHRPTDVSNIYSESQIRIINSPSEEEGVPTFEDIFCEEESDEENEDLENDDEDNETESAKRQRLSEEQILKRRERRAWEEKRQKIMFEYTQFSYYGRSSAMIVFELAWKLSKDNNDILWWAIVGVTEQMVLGKIENQQYVLESGNLQSHVSRLRHKASDHNVNTSLKITFDNDLSLAMYRHWTVESSIKYSMYTACQLKLWTLRGEKRLHELLAEMGLPLAQSRQNFSSMDLVLRKEFHEKLEKLSEKYKISKIVYASFLLQYGYRNKFSASDVVYSMLGVLESSNRDSIPKDYFMNTVDCLSKLKRENLDGGLEKAKKILITIFKQVQSSLDMREIISAGPFLYMIIQEGSLDSNIFSHPYCLSMLAHFALRAYVAVSKNRKAPMLPLVCSASYDIQNGTCLLLGVPPVSEDSPKNFFGKAFEQAAHNSNAKVSPDNFDSSIIQIQKEDRMKFLDALTALLS